MSETIRVLIVEDQAAEQETWQQVIELRNTEPAAIQFNFEFAASLDQAEAYLRERQYDAAIVDIRLDQAGVAGANTDGNVVIERVCQSGLMVVAAFTGERTQVASQTVMAFTKGSADDGDGTEAVLNWLVEQAPLIKAVRSAHSLVQQQLALLFHGSVWPRWKRWAEKSAEGDVELPLARHLTSHVHAALLEMQEHRVHPEEWYFIPPIRAGIRTGDVVRLSDTDFEIVVSPRCDLSANSKVTHILLAKCTCVATEWNTLDAEVRAKQAAVASADAGNRPGAEKKLKAAQATLREFTQHNKNTNAVHFLPRAWLEGETEFGPVFVNFDQLRSVKKESDEAKELVSRRVAAVAPEFLPSLVERLGSYLSRIGTPDYSHPDE
jgi:CheY-like chemotaxis protein